MYDNTEELVLDRVPFNIAHPQHVLDVTKPHRTAVILTWIDTLPKLAHYHTRGVYPNLDCQDNQVKREDLANHIEYNLLYRPGRALFVHGLCVSIGSLNREQILRIEAELKANPVRRSYADTIYH